MTQSDSAVKTLHLWEVKHDYSCAQAQYHENFDTWEDFARNVPSGDVMGLNGNFLFNPIFINYNLLVRWDWQRYENGINEDGEPARDTLDLFFIQQRRGWNSSVSIGITDADEPVIREWLTERANYLKGIWSPLLGASDEL